MKSVFILGITMSCLLLSCSGRQDRPSRTQESRTINGGKPRVIVMTDSEIDDRCSMVHFLLCSCDFEVDALIQTNSVFQRNGWSHLHWLEKEIDDYEVVYPNLKVHNPGYPSPDFLRSRMFLGDEDENHLADVTPSLVQPGEKSLIDPSEWDDTPGSDRIVDVLLEDDPRTVYIQAWGGGDTAARAFWKLKNLYPADYERAISKVVMYNIWYQDGAGSYIEQEHPLVTMLLSYGFSGTWDYGSQRYTDGFADRYLHKTSALAAHYLQANISEGDSPAFFHFIGNGLRSWENPAWGGWGGQFHKDDRAVNTWVDNGKGSYSRWIEQVNRDFEARLRWAQTPEYGRANHHPVITVENGLERTIHAGDTLHIRAVADDPDPMDFDSMWGSSAAEAMGMDEDRAREVFAAYVADKPKCVVSWSQMEGSGSYQEHITLIPEAEGVLFVAPAVTKPETLHLVMEATDRGTPALTSYARIIVTIKP